MRLRDLVIKAGSTWGDVSRELDLYLRDVREALNGGFQLKDQLRTVREVLIDTDALPLFIGIPIGSRPLGVVLVRAIERPSADGHALSGGSVEWDTPRAGVLRIHACSALSASTKYDATIAVVE